MDLSKYKDIVAEVHRHSDPKDYLDKLVKTQPGIKRQTLLCIYDQIFQRKMKHCYRKHTSPDKTNEHYFRYCENSQQNVCRQVILTMAKKEGLSPSLLARIILERHLAFSKYQGSTAPKGEVSELLKKPWKISDATLSKEIQICIFSDLLYGPITDKRKQSLGHEHEALLKRKLNQAGIPFQDETHLQSKGFDKTPDIVLQVPIAVDGSIITWIESKASFGDEELHEGYLRDQYWCYQNRFGPGLVIYWFGFLKHLDVHREDGILILDSFPVAFEVLNVE